MKNSKLISKKEPERNLLISLKERAGRSSTGSISVRHKGGGVKKLYRIVDFGQEKINVPGKILAIEYDPNRTSFLALVDYQSGEKRYIIAPAGSKEGDQILCADSAELKTGNRTKLKTIPVGTEIFNIELVPQMGGKLVRGAGTAAKVVAQEGNFTHLELPSGEIRKIPNECFATIGVVSNTEHTYEILGKAGSNRLKGVRPRVRGTAMIPPDHPHGGGQGKTSTGFPFPKTPWGKPARGVRTRKNRWTDKLIIKRRQKKNK
ncbi:MAG: 50S ribosomal protein L2 [Candidatus Pacebacteria bacterium]|nr:50S ribosomal protein L2 [Candidatus Paceibacterota bacterium]